VRTFVCRELTSKKGNKYERIYDFRKPVKQYYVYFHDALLGGPCYLKISSYPPAAHIPRAIDPHTVAKETMGRLSSEGR